MQLRLSVFCDVAGIEVEHFKSLRRRDQLPFLDETTTARGGAELLQKADEGRIATKWASYSIGNAVKLRCMTELMANGGLDAGIAQRVVESSFGYAELDADGTKDGETVWIGAEWWTDGEVVGRNHYGGTLSEILEQSEARATGDRKEGVERTRLVLANVSRAVREVHRRIEDLGL